MPDEFSLAVENIERDFVFRRALQIIIDDCSGRRIFADGLPLIELSRIIQAKRSLRLIKNRVRLSGLRVELAQGRNVIENPERASVRRDDEIVIFYKEIVNRRNGQI